MSRPNPRYDALLVDLDGVVTRTAVVHAAAWKRLLDTFLERHATRTGRDFVPFDVDRDYRAYVDGRPRYDGVERFLQSRNISLPRGSPDDPPERETICGLGNRKNEYFLQLLAEDGVDVYPDAVALIREARSRGLKVAVVTSSKNGAAVLAAAGLTQLFDERVDGTDLARVGLRGKPAPDMFLEAAKRMAVDPGRAIVLEDAVAGVEAGRRGGFALVVGVDRGGQEDALRDAGAQLVSSNLEAIPLDPTPALHSALEHVEDIDRRLRGRRLAVFLDYDGTLTPIVDRPDQATLSAAMRGTIRRLAQRCVVAVVSGRDRHDVEQLVGLEELVYAGSHGFDIAGPDGFERQHDEGARYATFLREAAAALQREIGGIDGVIIEPKRYALAVHFRMVADDDIAAVRDGVQAVAARFPELRRTGGKKLLELRPRLDWDKGAAVLWLLQALHLDTADILPIYLGDDLTDEDAFAALAGRGIGILVGEPERPSHAHYALRDPAEVRTFLERLIAIPEEGTR